MRKVNQYDGHKRIFEQSAVFLQEKIFYANIIARGARLFAV